MSYCQIVFISPDTSDIETAISRAQDLCKENGTKILSDFYIPNTWHGKHGRILRIEGDSGVLDQLQNVEYPNSVYCRVKGRKQDAATDSIPFSYDPNDDYKTE